MKFLTIFFILVSIFSLLGLSNVYINERNRIYKGLKEKDIKGDFLKRVEEPNTFIFLTAVKLILFIIQTIYILLSIQYVNNIIVWMIYVAFNIVVIILSLIKNKVESMDKEAYVRQLGLKYKIAQKIDTLIFMSYLGYVFYSIFVK